MTNQRELRKCKYHKIAFRDNAQFSEASKTYNGYVDIHDTNTIYDENRVLQPRNEYRIDDEYVDFCSRERHILELKKCIKETKTPKEYKHAIRDVSEETNRKLEELESQGKDIEDINVKLEIQDLTIKILSRYLR